jgi:hypothetical protein
MRKCARRMEVGAIDSWHKMAALENNTARMKLEDCGLEAFRRAVPIRNDGSRPEG